MSDRKLNRRPPGSAMLNNDARGAILAAAGRSFARGGLAGARTDVIAADAKVNKALLYYYFKSKEDLFKAVIEDHFREFNERALVVLDSPASPRAVLLRYVSMHMDFIGDKLQSTPLFQQMMMTDGKFIDRISRRYFAARAQALDRLLQRGISRREFRRVDRFQASVSIISLIVFYFSAARVLKSLGRRDAYSKSSLKRRKQQVLDFVRHGLFTDSKTTTS